MFSILMIGAVVFAMIMSGREGRFATSPVVQRAENAPINRAPSESLHDPVELSLSKLRLLWAALDGAIDEQEIARIARQWKNATENQVIPVLRDLVQQIRAGRGEDLMKEALDTLVRESEPVRLALLEEFGRMMQESGPLREQAAQLLGLWARRLLGEGASRLWQQLGF